MDSSFYGRMVDDLASGISKLIVMVAVCAVFVPFGIWKVIDIVSYAVKRWIL